MGTQVKKGYSIWSLLVVMTLLAGWMAVPRTVSLGKWPESILVFFIVFHQLTLWSLVGSVIWLLTGKRRVVMYVFAVPTSEASLLPINSGKSRVVETEQCTTKNAPASAEASIDRR